MLSLWKVSGCNITSEKLLYVTGIHIWRDLWCWSWWIAKLNQVKKQLICFICEKYREIHHHSLYFPTLLDSFCRGFKRQPEQVDHTCLSKSSFRFGHCKVSLNISLKPLMKTLKHVNSSFNSQDQAYLLIQILFICKQDANKLFSFSSSFIYCFQNSEKHLTLRPSIQINVWRSYTSVSFLSQLTFSELSRSTDLSFLLFIDHMHQCIPLHIFWDHCVFSGLMLGKLQSKIKLFDSFTTTSVWRTCSFQ